MKTWLHIVITVVVVIAIEIGVALGLMFSGWYNVAADAPDSAVIAWAVEETRESSIEARLGQVPEPRLDQPNIVRHGAKLYAKHCAECHLAPGMKPTGVHLGENPEPPEFAEYKQAPTPKEIYWIVSHGIKMTGMPAWENTLSDQQIWALAAFLQKLPHLSESQYQRLTQGVSDD